MHNKERNMSDFLNIRVTESELDLIMLLLEQAGSMEDSNGQPAFELLHDLMEQSGNSEEWETTDLEGRTFTVAEDDFIKMGENAREQAKLNSKLMMGTQSGVDVWTLHGLED
tara:strand:- start:889 stop:1224 length:336 start_codon:yes stop_codon:yes gene_type:complete